ncbi:MFS general substrate transporter [Suillus bovinus]|uniref:MFS general substrate transporter n=1 Tax=Suillus bovinus TaxID=48563 RepID=UPI001B864919|nr:MFS general substrate transporter [Suillus bovinus]KAG2147849.1 MFS general substrate transporter [Suillus bovinus]
MSNVPLLGSVDCSSRYDATSSGRSDGHGPTLPLADVDRPIVEKRLLRKLDLRVAFLVLVYIMNIMDRTNIAAARLRGFEEDLGMTGNQFNTLTSILFLGYLLTQAPSNMILHRMKWPSLYLSSCMAVWAAMTMCMSAVQTYYDALILRFFIGFVEATFFPGAVFLLSRWYKGNELGLRITFLFCGNSISYAFSALTALGILGSLDGALGFTAWRWLFFVEGALTFTIAVTAIWILPDFPSTSNVWLLPAEQVLANQRMEEEVVTRIEREGKPEDNFSGLTEALLDWRVWWLGVTLNLLISSTSFANFFPTLSATMGFSVTTSLFLCAPPWILGTATSFIVARHSDVTGDRFWHIVGPLLVGVAGYILAISTMNTTVRYLSLFLMTQSPVAYAVTLTWVTNTFSQSQSKRAAAIALISSMGSAGFISSSYFWPSRWGPSYVNSYLLCISTSVVCIAMCWIFREHLSRCNKAAEAEEKVLGLPEERKHQPPDTNGIQPSFIGYISKGIALCGTGHIRGARAAFDVASVYTDLDPETIHFLLSIKVIALFHADQHDETNLLLKELTNGCPNADIRACHVVR